MIWSDDLASKRSARITLARCGAPSRRSLKESPSLEVAQCKRWVPSTFGP